MKGLHDQHGVGHAMRGGEDKTLLESARGERGDCANTEAWRLRGAVLYLSTAAETLAPAGLQQGARACVPAHARSPQQTFASSTRHADSLAVACGLIRSPRLREIEEHSAAVSRSARQPPAAAALSVIPARDTHSPPANSVSGCSLHAASRRTLIYSILRPGVIRTAGRRPLPHARSPSARWLILHLYARRRRRRSAGQPATSRPSRRPLKATAPAVLRCKSPPSPCAHSRGGSHQERSLSVRARSMRARD